MCFKRFKSFQLSVQFYRECGKLKLPRHLKDQLMRASSSISLNIAESSGKRTMKDKCKFINIALGSARECQAVLELSAVGNEQLCDLIDHICAILYKNARSLAPT